MHDEKTSVGRAKVLSGGDTGYRLAEVDEVLGCLVVQTVEHHEAELERDPLRFYVGKYFPFVIKYCSTDSGQYS